MAERLLYGLVGGVLGALIAVGAMWFLDEIIWPFVGLVAAACALLAALLKDQMIDLLKQLWWWTD